MVCVEGVILFTCCLLSWTTLTIEMMSQHIDRYARPLNSKYLPSKWTFDPQVLTLDSPPPFPPLPSFDHLVSRLRKCHPTSDLLNETENRRGGESFSGTGPRLAVYPASRGPLYNSHPIHRQMHSFTSPTSCAGEKNSGSKPIDPLKGCRAASPISFEHSAYNVSRYRRGLREQAIRPHSRRESLQLDTVSEQSKRIKRMEKERVCRAQQANCLSRMEDFFRHYVNWERREQSSGNGNVAGLTANKINILRAMEVVVNRAMHEELCKALQSGPEAVVEFQRGMQNLLTSALNERPFEHTFLSGCEEFCSHKDSNSKKCITHNTADWRECRILRSRARFVEQRRRWMRENILHDQQNEPKRTSL